MNYELDSGVLVDANEFRAPELDRCLLALAFFILWYAFFLSLSFLGRSSFAIESVAFINLHLWCFRRTSFSGHSS